MSRMVPRHPKDELLRYNHGGESKIAPDQTHQTKKCVDRLIVRCNTDKTKQKDSQKNVQERERPVVTTIILAVHRIHASGILYLC